MFKYIQILSTKYIFFFYFSRTLKYLASHLNKISHHSSSTGMTDRNLAIVWAPNLLRSPALESGGKCLRHSHCSFRPISKSINFRCSSITWCWSSGCCY